jgi:hypothetical protein
VDGIEHASYLVRVADGSGPVGLPAAHATKEQLKALAASCIPVGPTLGGFTAKLMAATWSAAFRQRMADATLTQRRGPRCRAQHRWCRSCVTAVSKPFERSGWPRSSAVKARSQATNQIKALLVTGPAQLRHLSTPMIIASCARFRPSHELGDAEQATKTALRQLARRHQQLSEEIAEADDDLDQLVGQVAPTLLALPGVGPGVAGQMLTSAGDNLDRIKSEAAFAHLCGAAPIPASSGRTNRHRLNRGGDRGANNALYVVVLGRLRYDARTRAYVERRTREGLSKPEIIRCLKRYVAREIYNALPTSISQAKFEQPLARP